MKKTSLLILSSYIILIAGCSQSNQNTPNNVNNSTGVNSLSWWDVCTSSNDNQSCSISIYGFSGYIENLSDKDGSHYVDIQKVEIYTWEKAADMFAKEEPENCENIKKIQWQDKCYPLNNYYIKKIDKTIQFEVITGTTYELQKEWEWWNTNNYDYLKSTFEKNKWSWVYYFEIENNKIVSIKKQF